MEITAQTLETLSALVFLGISVMVVVVAIYVTQRLERRSAAGSSDADESNERRAVPDEVDDIRTRAADGRDLPEHPGPVIGSLFVVDDIHTASQDIEPWREVAPRDLSETVGHRHPTSQVWTEQESDGLVRLFRRGFQLDELAVELGVEPCVVVEELARRAFGAVEPVADPRARRFGQDWTAAELLALHSAAASGLRVADIARQLGRDQLSTVFRLLEFAEDARAGLSDSAHGFDGVEEIDAATESAGSLSPRDGQKARVREVALHG